MKLRELITEWVCGDCSAEPCQCSSLDEGARSIWGRSGTKQVRKYRCTSGQRKGRIVAKAATCNAPINQTSRVTMKKTKRAKANKIKINTAKTKRTNTASRRLSRINKRPKRRFAKGRSKKI
tara:strand:+ start:3465 stop:3830 length:366 start_codon:yes stop_codon:yes gene_type:complete